MATPIRLTHEIDIAWILALWKAIHGGDPIPAEVGEVDARTIELVHELGAHLGRTMGTQQELTFPQFQERFAAITGIRVTEGKEGQTRVLSEDVGGPTSASGGFQPPYCFHFKGATICIPRPKRPIAVQ